MSAQHAERRDKGDDWEMKGIARQKDDLRRGALSDE
jgi:hypothetical protein